MSPIVVWFRRDLRVDDHAALFHASKTGAPVLPLFVYDDGLVRSLPSDGAAFDFQAEALRELEDKLRLLEGNLLLLRGDVLKVHREIISSFQPSALYFNIDYEPAARLRDDAVSRMYQQAGADVRSFKDVLLLEPTEVLTGARTPYSVFTPFANAWKKLPVPEPFGKPSRIQSPPFKSGPILGGRELGRTSRIPEPMFRGGESNARKRWKAFLNKGLPDYQKNRDFPAVDGTSGMSAYLRFGCISVRRMYEDIRRVADHGTPRFRLSAQKFVDELIWREFYAAVLFHFPRVVDSNYRKEFDDMPWRFDQGKFTAWKEGRTGFPLVDAGMRQLNRTGWMHNRIRMVVASFLTKDLLHDWKLGARYFEEKLLDIETASNNGGWQWAASTGVDAKPLRIFSPRRQSERFDPLGEYIRREVPELRNVPAKYIHAPHEMPLSVQEQCGCRIGQDYPLPIVDHAGASAEYKRLFAHMKNR
jgi:deoxyribodipyrimidine photo-lyase